MNSSRLGWYVRRLRGMTPGEMAWRARDEAVKAAWSRRQVRRADVSGLPAVPGERTFTSVLRPDTAALIPEPARAAIIAGADRLLAGDWEMLGVTRTDMARPDWFSDPASGRRSDPEQYAFRINHRDQEQTGNVKQVWEISRLQHLTLLAACWFVTHEEAYAERAASQLRSWWRENPFLSGVNWTSGIELGIRLINFAWIRRLLDDWPGAAALFEHCDLAVHQIRWHQRYLATFTSRGSSANNHVIAEAAGQLAASCAFPWFPESTRWRQAAARLLERELVRNTFPSGINRELASDYHGFVAELGYFAAAEAEAAGFPVGAATWRVLCAMSDSMAALVDERLQPPRQADSDEGRVVLLDAPAHNRWPALLAVADALFGRLDWWPGTARCATSVLAGALARAKRDMPGRPPRRPTRFADAGITLLRTASDDAPELWCRCDGGPHGFLSIAAHAHADALSVEVRYGGVEVIADPGTYCYHGEPEWRSYFRSTVAHNTVELGGQNSSAEGGAFQWLRHANASETEVRDDGNLATWTAEHDGYAGLNPPGTHRRAVRLDRGAREIEIRDQIAGGGQDVRLAFHFGPEVTAELQGTAVTLDWTASPAPGTAYLELPPELRWSLHRGETDPILGWYSPALGQRLPAFTLLGRGQCAANVTMTTRLKFLDAGASPAEPGIQSEVR